MEGQWVLGAGLNCSEEGGCLAHGAEQRRWQLGRRHRRRRSARRDSGGTWCVRAAEDCTV